jgi:hypothetical protein
MYFSTPQINKNDKANYESFFNTTRIQVGRWKGGKIGRRFIGL